MRFGQISYLTKKETVVPLVRPDGTKYLILEAIDDFSEEKQPFKLPEAPLLVDSQGNESRALSDPSYKAKEIKYWQRFTQWMLLRSLKALGWLEQKDGQTTLVSEPIVWDAVDINDVDSYELIIDELKSFGLSVAEIGMLNAAVMEVNSFTSEAIDRAKESFFALGLARIR